MMYARAYCPLFGRICTGPELCAPALFMVKSVTEDQMPDVGQPISPECPIVTIMKAAMTTAAALLPLLLGGPDSPRQVKSEAEARSRIIESLGLED